MTYCLLDIKQFILNRVLYINQHYVALAVDPFLNALLQVVRYVQYVLYRVYTVCTDRMLCTVCRVCAVCTYVFSTQHLLPNMHPDASVWHASVCFRMHPSSVRVHPYTSIHFIYASECQYSTDMFTNKQVSKHIKNIMADGSAKLVRIAPNKQIG